MKLFILKSDHRFEVEIAVGGLHFNKKFPVQVSDDKVEEALGAGFLIEFETGNLDIPVEEIEETETVVPVEEKSEDKEDSVIIPVVEIEPVVEPVIEPLIEPVVTKKVRAIHTPHGEGS